jgi:hypothetical protein
MAFSPSQIGINLAGTMRAMLSQSLYPPPAKIR